MPKDDTEKRRATAIARARDCIDMIAVSREGRDRWLREALATGMTHRQVVKAIGTDPVTGKDLISTTQVRRVELAMRAEQ